MTFNRRNFVTGRPARIRDIPYVKGAAESWARWVYGGGWGGRISTIGRLMHGVKSNICPGWLADVAARRGHDPHCPDCHGRGRLPLKLTATASQASKTCHVCEGKREVNGGTCYRCRGSGVVVVTTYRVNPAGIRATVNMGGASGDFQSVVIDNLITTWRERDETLWHARVFTREYCYNGTQEMKAQGMRISVSFYKRTLREALGMIDQALFKKLPRGY